MAAFTAEECQFLEAIRKLVYGNPFLPERIEAEKAALGGDFVPLQSVWSIRPGSTEDTPNNVRLAEKTEALAEDLRDRLMSAAELSDSERQLYWDLVLYVVYYRYEARFFDLLQRAESGDSPCRASFFTSFASDLRNLLNPPVLQTVPSERDAAHLFACFYQLRRAFHYIFRSIVGGSHAAARLRASVWQSVFTHDAERYRRTLFDRMRDHSVLIMGPSGTGKELVARAIARSSYLPYSAQSLCFRESPAEQFLPLNLSSLSPTLIESELFGHRKGAFTGAQQDHVGWFEKCSPYGTVFLDEIGDTDSAIQVKLLRVLETRRFQRLGDTASRPFQGKIVAATNRNLSQRIDDGLFRQDLYYRLCSDVIKTPSLQEQICEDPEALRTLVSYLSRRMLPDSEADNLTDEVMAWIDNRLGRDYCWPGNVRELDQCVRNILIRREYQPQKTSESDAFLAAFRAGTLSAEQVLSRYCTRVYAMTGNYQETARRLELDHRTVKAKIDADLLEELLHGRKQ